MQRGFGRKNRRIRRKKRIVMITAIFCVCGILAAGIYLWQKRAFAPDRQFAGFLAGLTGKNNAGKDAGAVPSLPPEQATPLPVPTPLPEPVVIAGRTVGERFNPPAGYTRVALEKGSFGEYLRNYPLKDYGMPAYLWDGSVNEEAPTLGVFHQEITGRDWQQCADAIIRLWAEYLYERGEFDKISFDFYTTPIFQCDYVSWASGKRVHIRGNQCSWVDSDCGEDYSYETFREYIDFVHRHANTASLQKQMRRVPVSEISVGDVFVITREQMQEVLPDGEAKYGHAVIIVDMAVHEITGEKLYLIAEGNTPATETYIMTNTEDPPGVWHRLTADGSLKKGEWICPGAYIRRF